MFDELKNLNIETCSGSELKALIRQVLPTVITFVQASRRLLSEKENPCDGCNKVDTCKEPCELLEALLPSKYGGSYILSNTVGKLLYEVNNTSASQDTNNDDEIPKRLDRSSLKTVDRVKADETFMLYKNCHSIFTTKEWRVITLRVEGGHIYKAIGVKLGIITGTVSDTFRRAEKKMGKYYRRN